MDAGMEYSDVGSDEVLSKTNPDTSGEQDNKKKANDDKGKSVFGECSVRLNRFFSPEYAHFNTVPKIDQDLFDNYEFESMRVTMKPGPKSKTRQIITLYQMLAQLEYEGIDHETGSYKKCASYDGSIYIHPDLLKNFNFNTRKTNRPGPKSKTRNVLTMKEKHDQIVEAGINPVNGHFL